MINVALYEPEIPPNTGNIIRLCANTGARLHLVEPLGFEIDDRRLRRAGLDYHEYSDVRVHTSLDALLASQHFNRVFGISTKGSDCYSDIRFEADDLMLFGPETRGLPDGVLAQLGAGRVLRIPMQQASRSLNLSNAVAVVVYEAWRQLDFQL